MFNENLLKVQIMIKITRKTKCILIIIEDILKELTEYSLRHKTITETKMEFNFLRFALSSLVVGAILQNMSSRSYHNNL